MQITLVKEVYYFETQLYWIFFCGVNSREHKLFRNTSGTIDYLFMKYLTAGVVLLQKLSSNREVVVKMQ